MMNNLDESLAGYHKLLKKFKSKSSHRLAQKIMRYVMKAYTGLYRLKEIEDYYVSLALENCHDEEYDGVNKRCGYLHVLSEAYLTGGHTRVVERWIEGSKAEEKHSVCITNQRNEIKIPSLLSSLSEERSGQLYVFDSSLTVERRADDLCKLSNNFEYVVLHHHPDDPIPLMTFSFMKRRPKIIVFNHAGHLPWLGVSIADVVLSHERFQAAICKYKRGHNLNIVTNLMIDNEARMTSLSKLEARKLNDFKEGKCILISMASSYKYNSINNFDIVRDLDQLLTKNPEIIYVGIGVDKEAEQWKYLLERHGEERVQLKGMLPHGETKSLLKAADVYLDSYPLPSWTSILDAIWLGGLPVVCRKTTFGVMPFMEGSEVVVNSFEEWQALVLRLSRSVRERDLMGLNLRKLVETHCTGISFNRQIQQIVENWDNLRDESSSTLYNHNLKEHEEHRCLMSDYKQEKRWKQTIQKWKNSVVKRLPLVLGLNKVNGSKT